MLLRQSVKGMASIYFQRRGNSFFIFTLKFILKNRKFCGLSLGRHGNDFVLRLKEYEISDREEYTMKDNDEWSLSYKTAPQ